MFLFSCLLFHVSEINQVRLEKGWKSEKVPMVNFFKLPLKWSEKLMLAQIISRAAICLLFLVFLCVLIRVLIAPICVLIAPICNSTGICCCYDFEAVGCLKVYVNN